MSYLKIQYNRLYEQVIRQIEEQIKAGSLRPGDKLPSERDLTEKMGISRGTLREAFRILETQGIIETKPGGGRYLRPILDQEDFTNRESIISELQKAAIVDLLEVREPLEIKMAELACQRITDKEITYLEQVLTKALNSNHNTKNTNYEFHIGLAESTRNIVIVNFMRLNLDIINQIRERSFPNRQNFLEAQAEHKAILEAIKKRDVEEAKEKTSLHFKNILRRIGS